MSGGQTTRACALHEAARQARPRDANRPAMHHFGTTGFPEGFSDGTGFSVAVWTGSMT